MKGRNIVLAAALVLGLLSTQVVAAPVSMSSYRVAHVKQNDHLNVRAGAGVGNEIVTTIPFNGHGVQLLGDTLTIGKTRWVLIKWKGVTGWVSHYYLKAEKSDVSAEISVKRESNASKKKDQHLEEKVAISKEPKEPKEPKEKSEVGAKDKTLTARSKVNNEVSSDEPVEVADTPVKASPVKQDVWILQCGNKTPYWKVELHPKWMNVFKGDYETGLPITKKNQERNRWNTALKTVVQGRNGRNNLKMTIKYAYSKRCYDTLSGLRVPYKVTTQFNGEELTGCCRAVKLDATNNKTKLSMK